jgi:hypothetical protein
MGSTDRDSAVPATLTCALAPPWLIAQQLHDARDDHKDDHDDQTPFEVVHSRALRFLAREREVVRVIARRRAHRRCDGDRTARAEAR